MERRHDDPRICQLVDDVRALKEQMAKHIETTEQIRDAIHAFKLVGKAGKWLAAIGAGGTAVWHGIRFLKTGG